MEKKGLLVFFLAELCAVASGHYKKYYFVKDEKTWSEAQSYCRAQHTDLATIESQEEADNLSKTGDNNNKAWIGLYRDVEKNWQWSNSDAVIINSLEAAHDIINKSDITKESCVKVENHGKWTNEHCSNKNNFMCYKETSNITERYILIEELKTWTEAQQYCREHHTDLVSIKSASENEDLVKKAQNKTFWIGLFNNLWKWSHQGDNYTFNNWANGEPNNWGGKENCVDIGVKDDSTRGKWNDEDCKKTNPFICFDDTTPSVPPSAPASKDPQPSNSASTPASPDGKKLFLVNENKTWEEAVEYCRSNHADLVSIESEQELQRVSQEANKSSSSHVWLGLLQSCTFGFWYWVDGAQSCYDNWAQEPQYQSGCNQCGVMTARNGSKWTEKPCTERLNFICYNGTTGSSH